MRPVRVALVDDHEIVRAGLSTLLEREPDIDVVGTAATGEQALTLVRDLLPDILVVDYRMPGISGVEVCERVMAEHEGVAVILLTTYLDDEVVLRSIQAGARAYVYKDVEAGELIRAVRAVAEGKAVLDPDVTARVIEWVSQRRRFSPEDQVLSAREIDVVRLVASGASNKAIALELDIAPSTVKTYLTRVMEKLRCRTRSEAAAIAAKRGLL